MNWLGITLVVLIGSAFIAVAGSVAWKARALRGLKRWLTISSGVLIAVGGLGFFGNAVAGTGGFLWLPKTFEWPVGYARNVLVLSDGSYVVPHKPINRIQVYDHDWKFKHGWWLKRRDIKVFALREADTNRVEVITSERRYVYDASGNLVSEEPNESKVMTENSESVRDMWVPTRCWLLPFTGPFLSWLTMVIGFGLYSTAQKANLSGTVRGEV